MRFCDLFVSRRKHRVSENNKKNAKKLFLAVDTRLGLEHNSLPFERRGQKVLSSITETSEFQR